MVDEARPSGGIRVNPVDRLGRRITPSVLNAAEAIASRAIGYAERLHIDTAVAANVLEEAAARVSLTTGPESIGQRQIRDVESYLFCVFLRLLNTEQRQALLEAEFPQKRSSATHNSIDPRAWLDRKILIDELLLHCDPLARQFWYRRIEGFSWKEIGKSYKMSSHAAESRLSKALQKVRRMLGLK